MAFIQANLVNMLKGLEMAELFTLMSLIDNTNGSMRTIDISTRSTLFQECARLFFLFTPKQRHEISQIVYGSTGGNIRWQEVIHYECLRIR